MVGVILAFIFLTPRSLFRDQPRTPQASQVALVGADHGNDVLWIEPELLAGVPEEQRLATLTTILRNRTGKTRTISRLEPVLNSEGEIEGYMAFAKP